MLITITIIFTHLHSTLIMANLFIYKLEIIIKERKAKIKNKSIKLEFEERRCTGTVWHDTTIFQLSDANNKSWYYTRSSFVQVTITCMQKMQINERIIKLSHYSNRPYRAKKNPGIELRLAHFRFENVIRFVANSTIIVLFYLHGKSIFV